MLTFSERMDNLEAVLTLLSNEYNNLPTYAELDAAVEEIWESLDNLTMEIRILENNIGLVQETIAAAQG
jgi:lipid II:glycine glycyltransferase (peptidoglycan interpeptide bridge formation enzyme)